MEHQYRQYYKKDMNKSIFCDRWTFLTRCCYKYRTKCVLCPNSIVCEKYCSYNRNEYCIHPVKYATLMTLARLGRPKGELNMDYDTLLLRQADEYMSDCEPEIVKAEKAYEPDGYSMEYTYNCDECDNEECEYWKEYN